jgi:hypothetical protein
MYKVFNVTVALLLLTAAAAAAQVVTQVPETPPPRPTFAQLGMIIYPAQGQSPEQQKKDEEACMDWAEAQTGLQLVAGSVDTEAASKAAGDQAARATQGAAVGGAARGAIGGVAIGAIAGDAGKGAAIGAAAGAMGGLRARRNAIGAAEQRGAAQAEAANNEAIEKFKTAGGVCLQGRGYTTG